MPFFFFFTFINIKPVSLKFCLKKVLIPVVILMEIICPVTGSTFISYAFSGPCVPSSVCLDVISLQCALSRPQLGAEVHAPLNRPHLHLSIDGGAAEAGSVAMEAIMPNLWSPHGPETEQSSWGAGMGRENSSISQLGCWNSKEARKSWGRGGAAGRISNF